MIECSSSNGMGPVRFRRSMSDSPSSSSKTSTMPWSGSSSTSRTSVTWSLLIEPAARASRRKRSTAESFCLESARKSFTATGRPVRMFSAAKTSPMPPRPRGREMRYRLATTVPGSMSKGAVGH
jgi:hypothetical protein